MADPAEIIERYAYSDYEKWPEDFRCELIDGVIYMMSSPSAWHQDLVGMLYIQLSNFLKGKKCKVMLSPFDVRLFPKEDNSDSNILIPDLIVVCDRKKLSDGKACRGAPDFVIEILSKSTEKRDLVAKKFLYAKAGVNECWFINRELVLKNILANDTYTESTFHYLFDNKPLPVDTLPGCELNIPVLED